MGGRLARYLATPIRGPQVATSTLEQLGATLEPGDVLLVEGNTRVSTAIKYLTQSTWSHAMFYIGDALGAPGPGEAPRVLIEADMVHGIRAVPLSHVSGLNSRICRPVGLSKDDLQKVIQFAVSHIGGHYDLKNVFDLARYLIPTPPVPTRWRRRMIAFGSGDPTRAICSTLIAEAFQSVHYPILPEVTFVHDGEQRLLPRGHAYPALQPVHAARLRPLAVFRGGKAHHRQGLRLSPDCLGPGRSSLTREKEERCPNTKPP
jgi:hypothetical protein